MTLERDNSWIHTFQQSMLSWFERAARDLPWRRVPDPYRVWISEIMLQQTQVQQVIPYFNRFMQQFPTIAALAAAPLDQVLKAWEGMGYYARARNLHQAAQVMVARYQGRFPQDPEAVRSLPGIGPYTSAAILSLAFHQDFAVLDGNVARVLSRVYALPMDPKAAPGNKILQGLASRLLPAGQAAAFNEAMMELGATVCTPASPSCVSCPLFDLCVARHRDQVAAFPVKSPKKARPHYVMAAGLVWQDERLLIVRRPNKGLLGGLWAIPAERQKPDESLPETILRKVRSQLGITVQVGELCTIVKHQYTHFSITMHVFACAYVSGNVQAGPYVDCSWVRTDELERYAFSRADLLALEKLQVEQSAPGIRNRQLIRKQEIVP